MENENVSSVPSFKFDKAYRKRTIWIGLAFFGILLVWQLYNSYCAPMLSFLFAQHDYADLIAAARASAPAGKVVAVKIGSPQQHLVDVKTPIRMHFLSESQVVHVLLFLFLKLCKNNDF